ncbi:MAG: hypothetical protein AB7I27_00340 [Bacteriovoracaceae bacterium]
MKTTLLITVTKIWFADFFFNVKDDILLLGVFITVMFCLVVHTKEFREYLSS